MPGSGVLFKNTHLQAYIFVTEALQCERWASSWVTFRLSLRLQPAVSGLHGMTAWVMMAAERLTWHACLSAHLLPQQLTSAVLSQPLLSMHLRILLVC